MDSAEEPRMGRSDPSSTWDRLMAVWPPNWTMDGGSAASWPSTTISFSMMSRTLSSSSGSK